MNLVCRFRKTKRLLMTSLYSIQALLQQATEKGSRSTVLRPLAWLLAIWVSAILGVVHEKADFWLIILFSVFASLTGLLYLGTYVYCIVTKKETLLRGEAYSIQERLIDKGVLGPMGREGRELKPADIEKLESGQPPSEPRDGDAQ